MGPKMPREFTYSTLSKRLIALHYQEQLRQALEWQRKSLEDSIRSQTPMDIDSVGDLSQARAEINRIMNLK